jgi:hypothetical protein
VGDVVRVFEAEVTLKRPSSLALEMNRFSAMAGRRRSASYLENNDKA